MAIDNYKTEDPIKAESSASSTTLLDEINKVNSSKPPSDEELGAAFSAVAAMPSNTGLSTETALGSDYRKAQMENDAQNDMLFGYDFNYEYHNDAYLEQDNKEIQAQRQPGFDKFKRGTARLVGETLLNVLEIPGALGGAATAAVTGDITDMTNNWYLNFFEDMKVKLQDEAAIYKTEADKNLGVLGTLTNGSWWATEGVSAVAFFLSALVPGGLAGKAGKATQFMAKLATKGKNVNKIIKALDKIALKTGAASATAAEAAAAGTGAAAGELGNLLNSTLLNTAFESVLEARGAIESYNAQAEQRYVNGEMSAEEYAAVQANAPTVGNKVFWRNNALLLGPNLIMSKALLGKGSSSWKQVLDKIGVDKAGKFGTKKAIAEASAKKFKDLNLLGKAKAIVNSNAAKTAGEAGKVFAKNTFNEGIVEEMGQMAIENYWTGGYLNEQIKGERDKDIVSTYADVFNSKEGQIAALLGGGLGSGGHAVGAVKGRKSFNKRVDNTITEMNTARDLFTVARKDFYQYDKEGNLVTKKNEDGIEEPVVDNTKAAEYATARSEFDNVQNVIEFYNEKGEHEKAAIMEAKQQARAFMPFLGKGQEGLDALRSSLENNPNIEEFLEHAKETQGISYTKESFINAQMKKAEALEKDFIFHNREIVKPLFENDLRKLKVSDKEDIDTANSLRTKFNEIDSNNYINAKAALRETEEQLAAKKEAKTKLSGSKSQAPSIDASIKKLEKIQGDLEKSVETLETESDIEKRWTNFYNNAKYSEKYNSKELTGYLDDLVAELQKADSVSAVDKIINKAKDDGIFYSKVKAEILPKEVKDLAESNNIADVMAAIKIYQAHDNLEGGDPEYYNLIAEAELQLNSIVENLHDLLIELESTRVATKEAYDAENEKFIEKNRRYREITSLLAEANKEFDELNEVSDRKSAKFYEAYQQLVSAKRALEKELASLTKELQATNRNLSKLKKELTGTANIDAIINMLPSVKGKSIMNAKLNINDVIMFNEFISSIRKDKDALLNKHTELAKFLDDALTMDELKSRKTALEGHKKLLDGLLTKVEKALVKYKKYVKNKGNETIVLELEKELEVLSDEAERVAVELNEVQDRYILAQGITDKKGLNTFSALVSTLDLITALKEGTNVLDTLEDTELQAPEENNPPTTPPTIPPTSTPTATPTPTAKSGFTPAVDKTSGNGFQNLEDSHDKFIMRIAFSKDQAELESQFNRVLNLREEEALDPYTILMFAEVVTKFHPYLKESEAYKSFAEWKDMVQEELNFQDSHADELIATFEGKDIDENVQKQNEVVEQSTKSVENAEKALADDLKRDDLNFFKKNYQKAKDLVNTLEERYEKFKDTPIGSKIDELIIAAGNIAEVYKAKIAEYKSPTGVDNEVVATIKGSDALKQYVKELLEGKLKDLRASQLEKVRRQAQEENELWSASHSEEDYLTPGNTVTWEENGKLKQGKAIQFIKSIKSGSNVLIETEDGTMRLINSMQLRKTSATANNLNADNYDNWSKTWDEGEGKLVKNSTGNYTAVKLSTTNFGARTKVLTDENGNKVLDVNGNEQYVVSNKSQKAWKNYLEEPRDKSNDRLIFQIVPSELANKIKAKTASEEEIKAHAAIKKAQSGAQLSKAELEAAINALPITVRIEGDKSSPNNFAGTRLLTKEQAGENWHMELAVRQAIFSAWVQSGGTFRGGQNNIMNNVYANPITQSPGTVNTRDNTRTILTDMQGVTIENMELYTPRKENNGTTSTYDINGKVVTNKVPTSVQRNTGRTFMKIKTNTGSDFFLALQNVSLKDINAGHELDVIMDVLDSLTSGAKFTDPISMDTWSTLTDYDTRNTGDEDVATLASALLADESVNGDLKKITNALVFNTLIFSGSDTNQLNVSVSPTEQSVKIGDTVWKGADYSINREVIKKIIGIKFANTGFGGNGLKVGNKEYLKYIIRSGILTSAIPKGEAAFSTVTDAKNDSIERGLELYIRPDGIKSEKTIQVRDDKIAPPAVNEPIVPKKVVLTSSAKDWLRLQMVNGRPAFTAGQRRNLTPEMITMINELHQDVLSSKNVDVAARIAAIKNKC